MRERVWFVTVLAVVAAFALLFKPKPKEFWVIYLVTGRDGKIEVGVQTTGMIRCTNKSDDPCGELYRQLIEANKERAVLWQEMH